MGITNEINNFVKGLITTIFALGLLALLDYYGMLP